MKLHEMLHASRSRLPQYFGEQLGALLVGQMPTITENAADEHGMAAAAKLQLYVVIELDRQNVHIREMLRELRPPASEVRRIADRPAVAFEAEAARHDAVVIERDRN